MKWRRVIESILISALTLVQVLVCQIAYRRRSFARGDATADAAPILVIRCEAKIGDNLLNIPFLRVLRAAHPGREIHLLHHRAARDIYADCPYVDERVEITWPMSSPVTLLHRMSLCAGVFRGLAKRTRYGLAIMPRWDEDLYAPFLAWMSGAQRVVGFSRRVLPEKAWRNLGTDLLLSDAIQDTVIRHESVRSLQLIEGIPQGGLTPSAELEFWFSEEDRRTVMSLTDTADAGDVTWVALAPGAAVDRRKWPIGNFAAVVKALGQRPDVRLLLLGSSAEAADCEILLRATLPGTSLNLAGRLSLAQTAAALQTCRLFIGNDSGLLHLACAVRTPVIEISCHPKRAPDLHANSPARFGPTVEHSIVLRPDQPLSYVCRDGCTFDDAHCIATVTVASVVQAVASLLDAEDQPCAKCSG